MRWRRAGIAYGYALNDRPRDCGNTREGRVTHHGAIMSSEVRHMVDGLRPYPLIRFRGVLDATTAGTVRDVLLEVLAGHPEAVVVEVSGLEVGEPTAVRVLRDIRQATS